MDQIFQVQAGVVKVETKGRGVARIVFDTQENLSPEVRARIASWHNEQPGWLCFVQEAVIKPEDVLNLPPLTFEKNEKSPSLRLRNALHVLWEQKGRPTETSEQFYRESMEKILGQIKEKLT